jgi:DNA-binding MarR family transcriptional regulator
VARAAASDRREAAIMAAIHAIRRTSAGFQRHLAAASGDEVSAGDALALQFLAHHGDATPTSIAAFTGLTSGSVSILLDRLESSGLVTRHRDSKDRRVVTVRLAPGARQRLIEVMLHAHREVGGMFQGWSTKDIEDLVGKLERLTPG